MKNVIRSIGNKVQSPFFRTAKFRQATTVTTQPGNPSSNLDSPSEKTEAGNVMSPSFGEGYATRADEEGFGRTMDRDKAHEEGFDRNIGGNKSVNNIQADREINELPGNDESRGSQLKNNEDA